ncbi:hypothetical protein HC752_23155 [Vibrio sp. S9_S30]|uniref:hypothetical protein n=1 Tax=Vibrio sp. S9_S30 TaxID=2720226 RepID=UPI0016810101|nr:hypothetical protein [Vibrio sp. S9_S30]MBD1559833.1 hypothetical protein [Vibrio sp. S9_S30]
MKYTMVGTILGITSLTSMPSFSNTHCAQTTQAISCDGKQGIFYAFNNGTAQPYQVGQMPLLSTGINQQLSVAICNYNNNNVNQARLSADVQMSHLVPTIIANLSDSSHLRVDIVNSANVNVNQTLIVGDKLPEGPANNNNSKNIIGSTFQDSDITKIETGNEPALIDDVVYGVIGKDVQASINIRNSANVELLHPQSELYIGKGSLIEELINRPNNHANAQLSGGCFETNIQNSANVRGSGKTYIRDGQLENENFDYGTNGTDIYVTKRDVANVTGSEVHIFDGELSDETVDTGNIENSTFRLELTNVGTVQASYLRIIDGELVDELIDAGDINNSGITANTHNVATFRGDRLVINEGELLDETIDSNNIFRSNVNILHRFSATATATDWITIFEGELMDEVFDSENIRLSTVNTQIYNSANADTSTVSITQGELIDEVVDAENITESSTIDITISHSGKAFGSKAVNIKNGELIDEVIDNRSINNSQILVRVDNSALAGKGGIADNSVSISSGELIDELVDSEQGITGSHGHVTLMNSANTFAAHVNFPPSTHTDLIIDSPINDRITYEKINTNMQNP